jgi:pyruvate/2-oxoglutarate dehydrogenase complex dihydrolipoamide acyltransferase (E2) component
LGDSVVIVWRKRPGDKVERGEAVVEIETDTAHIEVTASERGMLGRISVHAGERAASGDVLAEFLPTPAQKGREVLTPPAPLPALLAAPSVFLAGSIEMGRAEPWQDELIQRWKERDVLLLNPRRAAWDASWVQSIENPEFRAQVEWELEAQERADLVLMYFAPQTQSPITLLELGLFARSQKLLVACPAGFWRRGNIEVVCARYKIPLVESLGALCEAAEARLGWSA